MIHMSDSRISDRKDYFDNRRTKSLIIDPFGGRGTTSKVAQKHEFNSLI